MVKRIVDPRQKRLFDIYDEILSDTAKRRIQNSWHFLFRQAILELMPANELGEYFDPEIGRPTKELFSIAGLLLVKEFNNLTNSEASDAYMFDVAIQYALNLQPEQQSLCERTVERYLKIFRESEMPKQIMQQVTCKLVELLELDVSKQRLDSTHVKSNMALFGRTRLMGVAIKNFLTQLKRHDVTAFEQLPQELRDRYEPSKGLLFGGWKKDEDWNKTRQQVAEEMHLLVHQFAKNTNHNGRSTYQILCQVFNEQCEVKSNKVTIRESTGGKIIVNPSDVDATLDGHKGSGYQVQLSETCSEENETQLIVSAIPQQAHQSDAASMNAVLEDLTKSDLMPDEMLADTAYGSDENFVLCQDSQIELIAPVPGKTPEHPIVEGKLTTADFEVEVKEVRFQNGERHTEPTVSQCPGGFSAFASNYNHLNDSIRFSQDAKVCADCPLSSRCPVDGADMLLSVTINAKQTRLIRRRRNQETEEFKKKYRKRSGIEATNSGLKRTTGLSRLRVRGKASVFQAMLLKVTGWNIMRAASNPKLLARLLKEFGGFAGLFLAIYSFISTFLARLEASGKRVAKC
jgi:hypothetical protein